MPITPCREKWKGSMTGRQRFNNQMHYKPVDRCFNMEFGYWEENFHQWKMFRDNGITDNDQADVFFNFDRIAAIHGNVWLSPPFRDEVVSETATSRIIRNGDGLLAEVPTDGHDTIPHFLESSITTPDHWRQCKAERMNVDSPDRTVDVAALIKAHPPDP